LHDEVVSYEASPADDIPRIQRARQGVRSRGMVVEDRSVFMEQLLDGSAPGRSSSSEVTYSARGNIQGAQFFAIAGRAYELAKAKGLGHEIPTEWLLQDIRDYAGPARPASCGTAR
jgi:alanine dehydrogenase